MSKISYFIAEGFRSFFVHGFTSFAYITVVAACLLVTCAFGLVAINVDILIRDLSRQNEIMVFVDETLSEAEAQALQTQICAISNVQSAQFISREELFDSYLDSLGEDAYIMEDMRDDNPLRDGYRVTMVDVMLHAETLDALMSISGIASTNSMAEVSQRLVQLREVINAVSVVLVALLGSVSIFIISNAVKLAMNARREEISIMKMVGATDGFICAPFYVEGALLGLCAGGVSYLAAWGVYSYICDELIKGSAIFTMEPWATFQYPLLVLLPAVGLLFGVGGGLMSIRRYLKV